MISIFLLNSTLCFSQELNTRVVAEKLERPLMVIAENNEYLWFTNQYGRVYRLNVNSGEITTILYIKGDFATGGNTGIWSITLSDNFSNSKYFYISYNYRDGSLTKSRVERWTYTGKNVIDLKVIIEDIPASSFNNKTVVYSHKDYLYIAVADANNPTNALKLNSYNGKILRLYNDGTIPEDNPFVGTPNALPEIYAYGVRSVESFSPFTNGDIIFSEQGDDSNDEINILKKGANYGWPEVRGYCNRETEAKYCNENDVTEPISIYYESRNAGIGNICYYNFDKIQDNTILKWQNSLLIPNLIDRRMLLAKVSNNGASLNKAEFKFDEEYGRLRDICFTPNGKVYILTGNLGGGRVGEFPLPEDDRIIELSLKNPLNNIESNRAETINLYPNPSYGRVEISNIPNNSYVEINDINGIKLISTYIDNHTELNLESLAAGIYYFVIKTDNKTQRKMLSIIK